MSFKFSSKIVWNGNKVKVQGEKIHYKSVFEAGVSIQGQAVALAPRDTSRLAGSIIVKTKDDENLNRFSGNAKTEDIISNPIEENVAHVGTNLSYSVYQEFGTRKMIAQPFLRPAFDLAQGKTLSIFEKNGKLYLGDYL